MYDLLLDPLQLVNLADTPGRGEEVEDSSLPLALALLACKGANCSTPQPTEGAAGVVCYETTHVAQSHQ